MVLFNSGPGPQFLQHAALLTMDERYEAGVHRRPM